MRTTGLGLEWSVMNQRVLRRQGYGGQGWGVQFTRQPVRNTVFDFPSPPRFRCPAGDVRWREMWSEVFLKATRQDPSGTRQVRAECGMWNGHTNFTNSHELCGSLQLGARGMV